MSVKPTAVLLPSLPPAAVIQPVCQPSTTNANGAHNRREFTTVEPNPPSPAARMHTLLAWHKYIRFTAGAGIISSSYDVFANAQRIVKVKEAKSEERTVKKTEHLIFI
ncbi:MULTISPECIES: hypothetical protein [unclassified Serratia (in: enterobacteria)]|uniref:hypothetical protein n=1 Tax=unclassified Serratia (in: enterobacteria) TaxID=2647522 RepID=UPI003076059C